MATGTPAGVPATDFTVELISTGDELLGGYGLNTHARTLGAALRAIGWRLVRDTTIGDDAEQLKDCLRAALRRAPVILVSGGLGPTPDDITVDAVAALLGRKTHLDAAAVERIHARGRARGLAPSASRDRQARVVEGSEVLQNPAGMAPGELLVVQGRRLFLLPGPPSEFEAILAQLVLPRLADAASPPAREHQALLRLCGCGESDVCEQFTGAGLPAEGVTVGFRACPDFLEVRFRAPFAAAAAFERTLSGARTTLGAAIFTEQDLTMEDVVCSLLRERGQTVAVAESCTGGLLGARLTAIPGSSAVFVGGIIAYSNALKTNLLQVPPRLLAAHGAVSPETACAMAGNVRRCCGSDYGLALTGIAGPGGGTGKKPAGLVYLALADAGGETVKRMHRGGNREQVRSAAAAVALDMLRRRLLGCEGPA